MREFVSTDFKGIGTCLVISLKLMQDHQGNKSKILELSWVIKAIFLEGHFVAYIGPPKIYKKKGEITTWKDVQGRGKIKIKKDQ